MQLGAALVACGCLLCGQLAVESCCSERCQHLGPLVLALPRRQNPGSSPKVLRERLCPMLPAGPASSEAPFRESLRRMGLPCGCLPEQLTKHEPLMQKSLPQTLDWPAQARAPLPTPPGLLCLPLRLRRAARWRLQGHPPLALSGLLPCLPWLWRCPGVRPRADWPLPAALHLQPRLQVLPTPLRRRRLTLLWPVPAPRRCASLEHVQLLPPKPALWEAPLLVSPHVEAARLHHHLTLVAPEARRSAGKPLGP